MLFVDIVIWLFYLLQQNMVYLSKDIVYLNEGYSMFYEYNIVCFARMDNWLYISEIITLSDDFCIDEKNPDIRNTKGGNENFLDFVYQDNYFF